MFVTFTTDDGSNTEQLDLSPTTPMSELKPLLEALFGIPSTQQVFVCDGRELETSGTLASLGVKENDVVMVIRTQRQPRGNAQASNAASAASTSSNAARQRSAGAAAIGAGASAARPSAKGPVYWDGMSVHDVLDANPNPVHAVQIIQSHENLIRELNFHNPKLAEIMRGDKQAAIKELRRIQMMSTAMGTVQKMKAMDKEGEMKAKLESNPEDEEAKKYFSEKERKQLIQEQLAHVMQEYPESLTRVLMLYVDVKINGIDVQGFVDSGAQTSVMSHRCAKRLKIDHLIDENFSRTLVGVGSGQSLGVIHLVPMNIGQDFFPISVTVLNDEKGLGDQNMDFLIGLDMLKRHRCTIDLTRGVLKFEGMKGIAETPFLHEKDLPVVKGGTQDFDPNKEEPMEQDNDANKTSTPKR